MRFFRRTADTASLSVVSPVRAADTDAFFIGVRAVFDAVDSFLADAGVDGHDFISPDLALTVGGVAAQAASALSFADGTRARVRGEALRAAGLVGAPAAPGLPARAWGAREFRVAGAEAALDEVVQIVGAALLMAREGERAAVPLVDDLRRSMDSLEVAIGASGPVRATPLRRPAAG